MAFYSTYKDLLDRHSGLAATIFLGITAAISGAFVGLGPASDDVDRNAKKLIVAFGVASIIFLWTGWASTLSQKAGGVISPILFGASIALVIAMVAVYWFGSPPVVGPPEPPPPKTPIPPAATDGWQPWHPLELEAKVFDKENRRLSAVTRARGEINIFAIGDDGQVWNAWRQGYSWRWDKLPDNVKFTNGTPQVTAVSVMDQVDPAVDELHVFAIAHDGHVWTTTFDGRHWEDWRALPRSQVPFDHVAQTVAAISRRSGKLDLFVMDSEGVVRTTSWDKGVNNGAWDEWRPISAVGRFEKHQHVSAVARSPFNIDIFVVSDGNVVTNFWYDEARVWSDWNVEPLERRAPRQSRDPVFRDNVPVTAISKSLDRHAETGEESNSDMPIETSIDVFAIDNRNAVWSNWWAESLRRDSWWGWFALGNLTLNEDQHAAAVARSLYNIDVFGLSPNGQVLMTYWRDADGSDADEGDWHPWSRLLGISSPRFSLNQQVIAVSSSSTQLDLFIIGNDNEIWTTSWHAP